jgi:hypothetical protein
MVARVRKPTPGDELAAVDEQIDELVAEGEALSARQGDAEALIRSYPDRREAALTLKKLGEHVVVPDEAERARLQRSVAEAVEEQGTIRAVRLLREEEKRKVLAAGLPRFDAEAEAAARAVEAEGEALLAKLAEFLGRQQAKGVAWRRSYDGRHELGREQIPAVGYHDLGDVPGKVKDAVRSAWPGGSREAWERFREQDAAPKVRVSNAEAVEQFAGREA